MRDMQHHEPTLSATILDPLSTHIVTQTGHSGRTRPSRQGCGQGPTILGITVSVNTGHGR